MGVRGLLSLLFLFSASAWAIDPAAVEAAQKKLVESRQDTIARGGEAKKARDAADAAKAKSGKPDAKLEGEAEQKEKEFKEKVANYDKDQASVRQLQDRLRNEAAATQADKNANRISQYDATVENGKKLSDARALPHTLRDENGTEFKLDTSGDRPTYQSGDRTLNAHLQDGKFTVSAADGKALPKDLGYQTDELVDLKTGKAVSSDGYKTPTVNTSATTANNGMNALSDTFDALSQATGVKGLTQMASDLTGRNLPTTLNQAVGLERTAGAPIDMNVESALANKTSLGTADKPYQLTNASVKTTQYAGSQYYFPQNVPPTLPQGYYSIPNSSIRIVIPGGDKQPYLTQNGSLLALYSPVIAR